MSPIGPGLRHIAVHDGQTTTDLSLPAAMPVAHLLPSIVDLLGLPNGEPTRYRLSRLGAAPLPSSTTLVQNDIHDGEVLVLSRETPKPPIRRCDDDAESVATALSTSVRNSSRPRRLSGAVCAVGLTALGTLAMAHNAFSDHQHAITQAAVSAAAAVTALACAAMAHRLRDEIAALALSIVGILFAAAAGLLAVPGAPGAPHLLLTAMAAAAIAVLALRITHCGRVTLTAIAVGAGVVAMAALAGVATAASPLVLATVTALVCLGLLGAAPRVSIPLAGLSPRLSDALELEHIDAMPADEELCTTARRADRWLTSLSAAFASTAGLAAAFAAATAHHAVAFAALTAGLLLLRARADNTRALVLVIIAMSTAAAVFATIAVTAPALGAGVAALTATSAAAAIYVGSVAPAVSLSAAGRRGIDAVECVGWAAAVPLACWTCGAFAAVRGLIRA